MTTRAEFDRFSDHVQLRDAVRFLIKLTLFPFRFTWLLVVWIKLRIGAFRG